MDEITGRNWRVLVGDVRDGLRTLADNSVHCCVTSPPYWGLRDYGVAGQIGREATPDQFLESMVAVFSEVRRALRPDGTLWLNIGDSYCSTDKWGGGKNGNTGKHTVAEDGSVPSWAVRERKQPIAGIKPKDMMGMPWRLAFALQAAGWHLRDCIIWHKPNVMPGSMTDRTCTAHEYIFLLTKSPRYYFDQQAISEPTSTKTLTVNTTPRKGTGVESTGEKRNAFMEAAGGRYHPERRNPRSVWPIALKSFKGAHFATFPPELPERCIRAGTSEKGCCSTCGAPFKRQVEKTRVPTRPGTDSKVNRASAEPDSPYERHSGTIVGNRDPLRHITSTVTIGWLPTCKCEAAEPVRCTVLDPFSGSGTTGMVATELNCQYIGCELNPEYAAMTHQRIGSWKPANNSKRKTKRSRVTPVEKSLFS